MNTTPRLTYIEWLDSAGPDEHRYHTAEELKDLCPLTLASIGWLFKESKDFIVVVPHWCEDDRETNLDGAFAIPKKIITRRIDFVITEDNELEEH